MRGFSLGFAGLASMFGLAMACGSSGDPAAPSTSAVITPPTQDAWATSSTPTWYRDVEPIVQVSCAGCHDDGGTGGFVLTAEVSTSLASFVAGKLSDHYMPPWPPDGTGAPLADARALTDAQIATWAAWAAGGAPLGDASDHLDRAPTAATLPARPFDLELTMPETYIPPASPFVSDEIRCFVLDLPASSTDGAWVTASQWRAGQPIGVHSLTGVPLDAMGTAAAHALEGADGRAGFECGGGYGSLAHGPPIGTSGAASDFDGSTLPAGTAVVIPAGGALLMRVHYAVAHLGGASDVSKVRVWLATAEERSALAAMDLVTLTAPVEVPCATGLVTDDSDDCSRAAAFSRLALAPDTPAAAQTRADVLLTSCGTTLDAQLAGLAFTDASAAHFYVPSMCASALDHDVTIHVVHPRMHTYGASMTVETENADGTWSTLIAIPTWRWAWDGAFVVSGDGVRVAAGRKMRVSCIFDNGMTPQWSSLTGEPGHDAYARPPLLPAKYLVTTDDFSAEECVAYLGVTE